MSFTMFKCIKLITVRGSGIVILTFVTLKYLSVSISGNQDSKETKSIIPCLSSLFIYVFA